LCGGSAWKGFGEKKGKMRGRGARVSGRRSWGKKLHSPGAGLALSRPAEDQRRKELQGREEKEKLDRLLKKPLRGGGGGEAFGRGGGGKSVLGEAKGGG